MVFHEKKVSNVLLINVDILVIIIIITIFINHQTNAGID